MKRQISEGSKTHDGQGRFALRRIQRSFPAVLALCLASSVAHAGAEDPERNATEKVNANWVTGFSGESLEQRRVAGERIVDLNIESTAPWRFTAAFVANTGTYQRVDRFWFDKTAAQVTSALSENNARIVSIDASYVNGQPRFAFSTVRNEGTAAKGWWWNYDVTVDQVTRDINLHHLQLTSLKSYDTPNGRRFVYVGIKNEGTDARNWWWHPGETPDGIGRMLRDNSARLVTMDRTEPGRFAVIMVQDPSPRYSWWAHGTEQERTREIQATHGVRVAAVDSYVVGGKRQYSFVGIDNTNAETARLRGYLDQAYDDTTQFGSDVIRGAYVKQVGGPVLVDLAANLRFQPLSTLKLLPYLYVWDRIDNATKEADNAPTTLATRISWTEATGDPFASCLTPGAAGTRQNSAELRDALPTMMWYSHNRTLDSILERYDPDTITTRGRALGLLDTEMHFGCPQPGDPVPWAKNRSTLIDIGRIFEGVHQGTMLRNNKSSRDGFFDNIIRLNYAGAEYLSPYLPQKVGPLFNGFLRDIVRREAGPNKQGQVEEFLKRVVLRGKGGSGGPSSDEFGYSDALYVELPVWKNGAVTSSYYVSTWFIYKLHAPAGCPDSDPPAGSGCDRIWQPEQDVHETFKREILAGPIRAALATWPASP
ncbi:MAG TPA: serine hydrolase [Polyangiaceae bacterium]|nr:serine hydrolase [Polyangiaceae bacterium]